MTYSNQDIDTLARTIYGEARSELNQYGLASFIAVANVILNRYKKNFAQSIHEVCIAKYQFSCWNDNDPNRKTILAATSSCPIFEQCIETATNILSEKWPDLTDGCDHYHANYIKPYWAAYKTPKRIIGMHHFYEL